MQFHPQFPFGKGMWIWYLSACMGGDIQRIIQQCKDFNISYVIVKCGDGENTWDQFTSELVNAFHTAGIKIYSWSYVYGNNPLREAAIAMWALDMNVDGHVFDAESEYEGKNPQAEIMLQAVRNHSESAFLAYAPFPIIDSHPTYPYVEFGKYCDAVMPQIYWGDFQKTPLDAVNWMYDNFSRWQEVHPGSTKPIIPLGQAYDNPDINPPYKSTPEDLAEFISVVRGYMSVTFWSFQHILGDPLWEAIRDNNVKAAPAPSPVVPPVTPVPPTSTAPEVPAIVVTNNPDNTIVTLPLPDNQNAKETISSTTNIQVPVSTTATTDLPSSSKTTSTTVKIDQKTSTEPTPPDGKMHIDYFVGFFVQAARFLHLIK